MILIIEGIDRVGKTTLCKKLSEKFRIPIHKYSGIINCKDMQNDEESYKSLMTFQLLKETNSSIILDRAYFTDFVYGVIERGYNEEKAKRNFEMIDKFVSELNDVFIIYVLPTSINRSSNEHGKDLSLHDKTFYDLFLKSKIKNKFRCTYNTLYEALLFVDSYVWRKSNEKCSDSIND